MAVDLEGLVPRLRASLVVPGSPSLFSFTDDNAAEWAAHLANAFWQARLSGLFATYRVVPDTSTIEPITPGDDDLPEEVHQMIVLFGALIAIEARFMSLANTRFHSGEQQAEIQRPLTLLKALLDYRRAELDELKKELGAGPTTTSVAFLDMVSLRHRQIASGYGAWVA